MKLPKKIIRPWQKKSLQTRGGDKFYQSVAWKRCRKQFLENNPLCVECKKEGRPIEARVVDHIVPRKDGGSDFSQTNLQSMCVKHHAIKSAKEKRRYGKKISTKRN